MRRSAATFVLGLLLFFTPPAINAETDLSDNLGPHLTSRQKFLVYPHLDKGLRAQSKGKQQEALRQFKRAVELAPESPEIALYLARAYLSYSLREEARHLISPYLQRFPEHAELHTFQRNLELAKPLDPKCLLLECRIARAEEALKQEDFKSLEKELAQPELSQTPPGILLRRNLLQKRIFQKQWAHAEVQFEWLEKAGQLQPDEAKQWLWMYLNQSQFQTFFSLRQRLKVEDPKLSLALGLALARQNSPARLANYLKQEQPRFHQAEDEREWLQLLLKANLLSLETPVQFEANYRFKNQLLISEFQKNNQWDKLERLLKQTPELATGSLGFEQALRNRDEGEIEKAALRWLAESPERQNLLDVITYRLIEADMPLIARNLLSRAWPFEATEPALKQRLFERLAQSIQLTQTQPLPENLRTPLPTAMEREMQAPILAAARDCRGVVSLFQGFSGLQKASSWIYLAECYQTTHPGLAQYAYTQALKIESNEQNHRALAYQAYQNQNFEAAVQAWQNIDLETANQQELLAAIRSALEAARIDLARNWLSLYQEKAFPLEADYWRALARTQSGAEAATSLLQATAMDPLAQDYAMLSFYYQKGGEEHESLAALNTALTMEPDSEEYQRAYGYALLRNNQKEAAIKQLEKIYSPDDLVLTKDLAFIHQKLDHKNEAGAYAARASDLLPASQERFNFRRMHEDLERRWTFSLDGWTGTPGGSQGGNRDGLPGNFTAPANLQHDFQSFTHMEAEYRLGYASAENNNLVSLYARVYAGGEHDQPFITAKPVAGMGVRWKPLSDQIIFLAAEHVQPLYTSGAPAADTLLRISASFFNQNEYSDDWKEEVKGWWARNLFLDAAHYLHAQQTSLQADFRYSYHKKIRQGQTLEPYAHLLVQDFHDGKGDGSFKTTLAGLGIRWNYWFGETQYDAWRHKMYAGLEYQRILSHQTDNHADYNQDIFRFSVGVRW